MTNWSTEDRRAFLTVTEVAERWHVSTDKVRADIRKGALQAYTVAGCIRVRVADAETYGQPISPA
jgi:excisionase family DNA binding protein